MNAIRTFSIIALFFIMADLSAEEKKSADKQPLSEKAMATLPLKQLLDMQAKNKLDQKKESQPMALYTLEQVHNSARLLENALDIQARFNLAVLKAEWVAVELLQLDSQTQLAQLPEVNHAYFRVENNKLYFMTKQAGRFNFSIRFFKFAKVQDQVRKVSVQKQAALAMLELVMDPGLFEITGKQYMAQGNKLYVFPQSKNFVVTWRNKKPVQATTVKQVHRPLEPVVVSAHASTVATLSGKGIIRVLYKLRFTGQQTIQIDIPKDQELAHVFLNGAPQDYSTDEQSILTLQVKPPRAGDQTAQLELLLQRTQQSYVLSGDLEFVFPKVSWRVNDLYATLYLPTVFNYQWQGGSLVPSSVTHKVQYSHTMPTPGKEVTFHQQLIRDFPILRIEYAVDLQGNYYTGQSQQPGISYENRIARGSEDVW